MAAPLVVEVSGLRYEIPGELRAKLLGPEPDPGFACDGCSASPDHWPPWWLPFGGETVSLLPPCCYHDWAYALGDTREDRRAADARFYWNLTACGLSGWWAGVYYRRVRLWGLPHFAWAKGHEPNAWTQSAVNLVRRYGIPNPATLVPPTTPRLVADAA